MYKTDRECTRECTESNKSRKCLERDSNRGPPDCDHWVTLPPTVTELFPVKLINRLIACIAAGPIVGRQRRSYDVVMMQR